ncbi:MAG: hypothetical protein KKF67_00880 [Nanoarchaeota archaeon]|nr:hypothetical protein [Nanoarchaeota archaeon]
MTQVIKKGGKRQAFSPSKIRASIKAAAREARLPQTKAQKLVKEVGDSVISFYKKKRIVKSTAIRKSILGRLERKAKAVASAWRRHKKKKRK